MPAAAISQDAGHAGDHRRDQDDEPDDDHDVLRSELLTDAGRPRHPARLCRLRRHRAGVAQRFANRPERRRDRLEPVDRALIRWKMSSRTAAPTMAVSQVDRLKNPCRVWTWNSLVATQPPPSAPRTPITQVKMRPCDLLPGISILASRPATRPRTIHAMMPITDSLSQRQGDVRGGRSCWEIAVGRGGFSGGVLTAPWPWRLSGTVPCTSKKKFRSCGCFRRYRGAVAGVRSNTLSILPY